MPFHFPDEGASVIERESEREKFNFAKGSVRIESCSSATQLHKTGTELSVWH